MKDNAVWAKRRKKQQMKFRAMVAAIVLIVIAACVFNFANPIRFDYAGGSHRIIPTAVDTDFWGNYKVYFKTSEFTQNKNEDCYYIEKGQDAIAAQVNDAVASGKELVVYYDRYMGWKGFTAPKTSPIIKVETIRTDVPVK